MEEVETALKSLSLKQPKTPGIRNSNDRVAFIQSGRVSDQVLKLREEGGNANNNSKGESVVNSPSNGEDSDEMPSLTDSDSSEVESNDEFPPMPPLTNSEPFELL